MLSNLIREDGTSMYYRRKKRLTNAARVRISNEYFERKEEREREKKIEKREYEKDNTYLFYPLENNKYYFSFMLMKNGNAKIMDIHGDVQNVEIPELIISADTVRKKFEEQTDFNSKFPIKITVLGRLEIKNLKTIILPNTIGRIFEDTFRNNESLEFVQLPKYLKVIDEYAFYNCKSLVNISIPYSITSIGENAFANCTAMKSIKLTKRTESYGDYFLYNSGIEILNIPANITNVNSAFSGLDVLKRLYIHEHVSEITASFNSINLTKIIVDERNEFFDSRQGSNSIINSKTNELLLGCKNTKLPNDVKITNLNKFSSYGNFLVISEKDLFEIDKSPMEKFIRLNNFPTLYFTFNQPSAKNRINWYDINLNSFKKFASSDKFLYDIYLFNEMLEEISTIDNTYIYEGSSIYFEYPFAFYQNEWKLDSNTKVPVLINSQFDPIIPRSGKVYNNRQELIDKCEKIIESHLLRFESNKDIYKKDYISRFGLSQYKIESVRKDFKEIVKKDPESNHFSYYVDNTWVSWTEIRGSEYNELCDWDEINLKWVYTTEQIW